MKYIYIFNKQSPASVSGIGTYIDQIKKIFYKIDCIKLNIINYNLLCDEFTYVKDKKGNHTFNFPIITNYTENKEHIYMRNLWTVLRFFIEEYRHEQLIFHFNYYQDAYLIPFVKKTFSVARVIFSIHYLDWGLLLSGNTSYFKKNIRLEFPQRNEENLKIYNVYQRDRNIFSQVDHIICLCKYTQVILEEIYQIKPNKISLIPNGVQDDMMIITEEEKTK